MCLIAFAWQPGTAYPLQLLANRDEFFARPTAGVHQWPSGILAGRDGLSGGSWLGVHPSGRFAAVTNYRDPRGPEGPRSRGALITDFLIGQADVGSYLERAHQGADDFSGFNLLVGDGKRLGYLSNREGKVRLLAPGYYGLSNALLDSPWPKLQRLKQGLVMTPAEVPLTRQMDLLTDTSQADDAELPQTGIGLAAERVLSSVRIPPEALLDRLYGTRSSSVITLDHKGKLNWLERQWQADGRFQDRRHGLTLTPWA